MPADVEQGARMALAVVLVAQGRRPEAVTMARPICVSMPGASFGGLKDMFLDTGVCK